MRKKLIFVAGYCATGKTAFSLKLAKKLDIPCFNKDFIKESLGTSFDYENKIINKKLSSAAFSMLEHIAEKSMEANVPVILESNFRTDEAERLKILINKYNCDTLTYLFLGNLKIVHKRFMERERSPERHQIHKSHQLSEFKNFKSLISPLKDFNIGGREIVVDTTDFDSVDFNILFESAARFMLK